MHVRIIALTAVVIGAAAVSGFADQSPFTAARRAELLRSALSAAPSSIAAHATVMAPGPDGKMVTLQKGSNGFTCFPDDPGTPGPDPVCADAAAMKWNDDYSAHASRPTNTVPGIMYMLAGGSDASNTDPYAKAGPKTKWVTSGAHWMLMWPMDPKTSGFGTTPKRTGSYIMWAGTPWAHLMVNQIP